MRLKQQQHFGVCGMPQQLINKIIIVNVRHRAAQLFRQIKVPPGGRHDLVEPTTAYM